MISITDKNIQMLTRKVQNAEYKYMGMLSKHEIKQRLTEYTKIKKDKKVGLNEAEYFMVSGYVNALEWVLGNQETDIAVQKESMYKIEHCMR